MASPRVRRRLLTAGVGVVAITAVEGLACGNPMEPAHVREFHETQPVESAAVEAGSAVEAATVSATDASDSSKASPPKR
jgi:hypothetical protein